MLKLTTFRSFIIRGTGLPSFIRMNFGSITKGMTMQHLCLQFLIHYSEGDGATILDRV